MTRPTAWRGCSWLLRPWDQEHPLCLHTQKTFSVPFHAASPLHHGQGEKPMQRAGTGLGGCHSTASREEERETVLRSGGFQKPSWSGLQVEGEAAGGMVMHGLLPDQHHSTGCWPQRMGGWMGFCLLSLPTLRTKQPCQLQSGHRPVGGDDQQSPKEAPGAHEREVVLACSDCTQGLRLARLPCPGRRETGDHGMGGNMKEEMYAAGGLCTEAGGRKRRR